MKSPSESILTAPLTCGPVLSVASIGCSARSIIDSAVEGKGDVHSIFDSAINITIDHGFISLVRDSIQRGPLNLVLQPRAGFGGFSRLGLRTGDVVEVTPSTLRLASRVVVSLESAETYRSQTNISGRLLGNKEIRANLDAAAETTIALGDLAGIGGLVTILHPSGHRVCESETSVFSRAARIQFAELMRLLSSDTDQQELREVVRRLIGLGPGLTPSADDALAGLMIMVGLYSSSSGRLTSISSLLMRVVAAEAIGRTTRLSEECLKQAALGRGGELVMNLCAAILTEGPASVSRATSRALAVGASSGTDTVFGVILGTMLCTDMGFQSLQLEMREDGH